jgi:hypothetical protein
MHPIPSAPSKRALRGLGGLLLGSLLLLGPGPVAADHDLTCHPPPILPGDLVIEIYGLDVSQLQTLVMSVTPLDDRTGTEERTRTIEGTIADQEGTTTTVFQLVVTPGQARAC